MNDLEYNISIKNSIFENNEGNNGGAIYLKNFNALISDSHFEYNKAENGGAVYSTVNDIIEDGKIKIIIMDSLF